MNIVIDKKSGFCFGVVYAIEMAEDILEKDKHLYCLGDIVHNNKEVDRLTNMGLEIIDHNTIVTCAEYNLLTKVLIDTQTINSMEKFFQLKNHFYFLDIC